jgi:hypothetical protein
MALHSDAREKREISTVIVNPSPSIPPVHPIVDLNRLPIVADTIPDKLRWISVSNLTPETSADSVVEFVREKLKIDKKKIVCAKITPRSIANPSFVSFKVGCPEYSFDQLCSQTFWPSNSVVREFSNTKSNFRQVAMIHVLR